jgi:hypothetical protein
MKPEDGEKKATCSKMRVKNSFGMVESGGSDWSGIYDPNAQYWCTKTAGAIGPDNKFVGPENCIFGRKCFQP